MMETLKSAALILLVGLSLVQSYFLSYSPPNFDPLVQDEYVKTDRIGSQAMLEDLLFPDQVVLHLGNQQHTVLYRETPAYQMVVESVNQRSLDGFRKTSLSALNLNWEEVRNQQQGIEVRFRDGVPINVLQRVMQLKGELPLENDTITKIWIFTNEMKDEVRTVLFTDTPNVVYEVQKSDISGKDIERFATMVQKPDASGKEVIPYKATGGDYYLPMKPLTFAEVKLSFKPFTVDQLKRSFFVDPAITRNLSERDGSEIYTDAKRGLQIRNDQRWMTYSDPVAAATVVDNKEGLQEDLLSAVQFVNQHGGWNGVYALQKVPQRLQPGNQPFIFRQYYGSLPLVDQRMYTLGSMKVIVQKGVVASFERSTIIPEMSSLSNKETTIIGGEALEEKLKEYSKKNRVIAVFPGYRTVVNEQSMDLIPAWVVELRDGSYEFLE